MENTKNISRASIRIRHRIRLSRGDKIYLGIVYLFLTSFVLLILYPLLYVISCSFSSPEALVAGQVFFLPVEPGLQGYRAVFQNKQVWSGYYNSIIYTIFGTTISTVVTIIGGYVLSRREFRMRGALTGLFTFTMFFGGGTMPMYLLIKNMKMLDTIWAIVLPGAFSVWLGIVARTFIQSNIPEELYESTCLDGGDYFQHFLRIVLPLSKPILAVLALNFATGHWNSYFSAMLYLNDPDKFPLQIILRNILIQNTVDFTSINSVDVTSLIEKQYLAELLKYSLIIVSSIPLLIVYPFIQKYFIKGIMVGSIKG
ncbi:MAG: carbohydrate ABC transporter permease [Candidatus Merdivicinus sp.]|jgi:putative aldouronate transport system permease protein